MSFPSLHADAESRHDPTPSLDKRSSPKVGVAASIPKGAGSVGVAVSSDGPVPQELGVDRDALKAAGFDGQVGQTMRIARSGGPVTVAFGIGSAGELDAARLRDAAAAFARASGRHAHLAIPLVSGLAAGEAAQALVEGVVLARYRYLAMKHAPDEPALRELTLVGDESAEAKAGAERGAVTARAAALCRDLGNAPATLLTARRMADIIRKLAPECGLEVEVFDGDALLSMGCGGMLGVNAGSAEPPALIKVTYRPRGQANGRIALVGKGIMFDSGGIGLKPNDLVHATMKTDMCGAAAVFASMTALKALDCRAEVTGYLCCTDNMPSGSAMKLGDILTVRGGKTVEVINTDAEGRLVMADGLALATEQDPKPDAIVDIATLTGACQRALGNSTGGLMGNDQGLIDQVFAAGQRTDDRVWQFELDRRLRKELDSEVADLKNVGGDLAGQITAALFLEEFVGGIPWAHIDIAGTANTRADESWRTQGATSFGTRLLIDFLTSFQPPGQLYH